MFIPHTDEDREAMLETIGVEQRGRAVRGRAGQASLPRA